MHFVNNCPFLSVFNITTGLFTVRDSLRSLGTYTDQERATVRRVRRKFFQLTAAFYVWWALGTSIIQLPIYQLFALSQIILLIFNFKEATFFEIIADVEDK